MFLFRLVEDRGHEAIPLKQRFSKLRSEMNNNPLFVRKILNKNSHDVFFCRHIQPRGTMFENHEKFLEISFSPPPSRHQEGSPGYGLGSVLLAVPQEGDYELGRSISGNSNETLTIPCSILLVAS